MLPSPLCPAPLHPSLILPSLPLPLPLRTPCPDWTPRAAQRSEALPPTATGRNGRAGESGQSQAGREEAGRMPGCGAGPRGEGGVSGSANESQEARTLGCPREGGCPGPSGWTGVPGHPGRVGPQTQPQMGQVQIHQEGSPPPQDGAQAERCQSRCPGSRGPGQPLTGARKVVLPLEAASEWGVRCGPKEPPHPHTGTPTHPRQEAPAARSQ